MWLSNGRYRFIGSRDYPLQLYNVYLFIILEKLLRITRSSQVLLCSSSTGGVYLHINIMELAYIHITSRSKSAGSRSSGGINTADHADFPNLRYVLNVTALSY